MTDRTDEIDEIDVFDAIAEYFNIGGQWSDDEKAAAGRYIMGQVGLRMSSRNAGEAGTAETTKIGSVHEHAVLGEDAPNGESS